jgi:hypothetical protein
MFWRHRTRKAVEHGRGFRRLVKWRTGCEGRISYLKRGYGWDAPAWTAGRAQRSGAGTGYSPATWSRSAPLPADLPGLGRRMPPVSPREISLRTSQVEAINEDQRAA